MNAHDPEHRIFLGSIAPYRTLLEHRLILLESLTEEDLKAISTGIVFVQAIWSMQSRVALPALVKVLIEPAFEQILLYVANIDKFEPGLHHFENIRFGGWGETLWLRQGKVMYINSGYNNMNLPDLRRATEALLQLRTEITVSTNGA